MAGFAQKLPHFSGGRVFTDSATDIEVRLRAGERATAGSQWGFVGWNPQPSAVGPVPHQPGFFIDLRLVVASGNEKRG